MGFNPGDRFTATNATVLQMVRLAYRFQENQVVDVPDWMRTERFDVLAKADRVYVSADGNSAPELIAMLRDLLADRFRLVVHREVRTVPAYALVRARTDGRVGANLRRVDVDCDAVLAARRTERAVAPSQGAPIAVDACAFRFRPGALNGRAIQISDVVSVLSSFVGRMVLDQANLSGRYDVDLVWTPDTTPSASSDAPAPPNPDSPPSIFTALQEQLGLKLDPTRGSAEVLVIDRVDRPTEN
jgi:uncharacterized protein (TIGR03435 family)